MAQWLKSTTRRPYILGLLVVAALFVASCSSDSDTAISDAVADGGSGNSASGGGDDGGGEDGGGDTTINIGGTEDSSGQSESEKLPGWAIALLVGVAILAIVGVALGFQNHGAQKTKQASEEGYRQGREDAANTGE
jgi:hypothetical protein